jgi:hypothetical protein
MGLEKLRNTKEISLQIVFEMDYFENGKNL